MITSCFTDEEMGRILCLPIEDYLYQPRNVWVQQVITKVKEAINLSDGNSNSTITLIGHKKDNSSYYLNLFPQWETTLVDSYANGVSATQIRNFLFSTQFQTPCIPLPTAVFNYVKFLAETCKDVFIPLINEYNYLAQEELKWKVAPRKPFFVTTDAIVFHKNKVLLVRRKGILGNGLLALPGGHLEHDLTSLENTLKELYEETNIKIPENALISYIKGVRVFDDPFRSVRGRTITISTYFKLPDSMSDIEVIGGSDASSAAFYNIEHIRPIDMFEDHYFQIQIFSNYY
jgi:bifunctional NMN adenylyltransferase/nudix hydrolase